VPPLRDNGFHHVGLKIVGQQWNRVVVLGTAGLHNGLRFLMSLATALPQQQRLQLYRQRRLQLGGSSALDHHHGWIVLAVGGSDVPLLMFLHLLNAVSRNEPGGGSEFWAHENSAHV